MLLFGSFLYDLFVQPPKIIMEFLFTFLDMSINSVGGAIVVLSVVVNFLLMPFYNHAEKIQKANMEKQKLMQPYVSHIRKHFHGAEQTMILSAYYRSKQYSPVSYLTGMLSLFVQIPVFLAAYHLFTEPKYFSGINNVCI